MKQNAKAKAKAIDRQHNSHEMDDEEQQEQPTVRVDPEKFRQVLRAFYQVHNPARIADTPEAQSNSDTLISSADPEADPAPQHRRHSSHRGLEHGVRPIRYQTNMLEAYARDSIRAQLGALIRVYVVRQNGESAWWGKKMKTASEKLCLAAAVAAQRAGARRGREVSSGEEQDEEGGDVEVDDDHADDTDDDNSD
jgi:hypothetical protein